MDTTLDENKVSSDAKENRYSGQPRCVEMEEIDSQRKEPLQNKFINSSRSSVTLDSIEESLKMMVASHELSEIVSQEVNTCRLNFSREEHKKQDNNKHQAKNSGESSQRVTIPTQNGPLRMEPNSLSITVHDKSNSARLSGKSLSDEDALSQISESLSGELNANKIGTDWRGRNVDVCASSTYRDCTTVKKASTEGRSLSREKEQSKKKISFRALVRMKGLGRKLRKKHQGKSKQKHFTNKTESNKRDLFFSDSSAKYLLESSTSVTDEQSIYCKRTSNDEDKNQTFRKKKSNSLSENTATTTTNALFQSLDALSSSLEQLCTPEYLEQRRFAVCEELEKLTTCGETDQTLAELRSILVIQNKLTGFGLL